MVLSTNRTNFVRALVMTLVLSSSPWVAAGTRYFPGVANLGGAKGSTWRSDLVLVNATDASKQVSLRVRARDTNEVSARGVVVVEANSTLNINNILHVIGAGPMAGLLEVEGDVSSWLRTYNINDDGTFGQRVPGTAYQIWPGGRDVVFPLVTQAGNGFTFRNALVLWNPSHDEMTVTLRSDPGTTLEYTVPAFTYMQVNSLANLLQITSGNAILHVRGTGRWFGFLSCVDEHSGDPTSFSGWLNDSQEVPTQHSAGVPHAVLPNVMTLPAAGDSSLEQPTIRFPGAARLPGVAGTFWRSELVLANPGEHAEDISIAFTPSSGGTPLAQQDVQVDAGTLTVFPDVLEKLGVDGQKGTVTVSGTVMAWMRTYTDNPAGTYGQEVPPAASLKLPKGRGVFPVITDARFRTNLLLFNGEESATNVEIRNGPTSAHYSLQPGELRLISVRHNTSAENPSYLEITTSGEVSAYTSLIDQQTGDPTTITAGELPEVASTGNTIQVDGGEVVAGGQVYNGSYTFSSPQLVAIRKDGNIYFYHPALGSCELNDVNSERALGYWLDSQLGSNGQSLPHVQSITGEGSTELPLGVRITKNSDGTYLFENSKHRWVVVDCQDRLSFIAPNDFFQLDFLGALQGQDLLQLYSESTRTLSCNSADVYGSTMEFGPTVFQDTILTLLLLDPTFPQWGIDEFQAFSSVNVAGGLQLVFTLLKPLVGNMDSFGECALSNLDFLLDQTQSGMTLFLQNGEGGEDFANDMIGGYLSVIGECVAEMVGDALLGQVLGKLETLGIILDVGALGWDIGTAIPPHARWQAASGSGNCEETDTPQPWDTFFDGQLAYWMRTSAGSSFHCDGEGGLVLSPRTPENMTCSNPGWAQARYLVKIPSQVGSTAEIEVHLDTSLASGGTCPGRLVLAILDPQTQTWNQLLEEALPMAGHPSYKARVDNLQSYVDQDHLAQFYVMAMGDVDVTVRRCRFGPAEVVSSPDTWAVYSLDGDAQDGSGNRHDGRLVGGVRPGVGREGKPSSCLTFDGSSGYVTIPDGKEFNAGEFTVELWFRVDRDPGWTQARLINRQGTDHGSESWGLEIKGSSFYEPEVSAPTGFMHLDFHSGDGSYAGITSLNSIRSLKVGTWYHVVAVRENTKLRLYINGMEEEIRATGPQDTSWKLPIVMGRADPVAGFYLDGAIDDVHIWTRALSDAEVQGLF